ncbi:hypothetical protein BC829DRAFT_445691 [Chytridium lagenaria]|nr:hypothetical protein BC829DRAFT_445691 [Chytridium lagenaria]
MVGGRPATWSKDEVGEWLETIGYGSERALFKEHDVDGYVLMKWVNAETLETGIGIKSYGVRFKISKAIEKLRNVENNAVVSQGGPSVVAPAPIEISKKKDLPGSSDSGGVGEAAALGIDTLTKAPPTQLSVSTSLAADVEEVAQSEIYSPSSMDISYGSGEEEIPASAPVTELPSLKRKRKSPSVVIVNERDDFASLVVGSSTATISATNSLLLTGKSTERRLSNTVDGFLEKFILERVSDPPPHPRQGSAIDNRTLRDSPDTPLEIVVVDGDDSKDDSEVPSGKRHRRDNVPERTLASSSYRESSHHSRRVSPPNRLGSPTYDPWGPSKPPLWQSRGYSYQERPGMPTYNSAEGLYPSINLSSFTGTPLHTSVIPPQSSKPFGRDPALPSTIPLPQRPKIPPQSSKPFGRDPALPSTIPLPPRPKEPLKPSDTAISKPPLAPNPSSSSTGRDANLTPLPTYNFKSTSASIFNDHAPTVVKKSRMSGPPTVVSASALEKTSTPPFPPTSYPPKTKPFEYHSSTSQQPFTHRAFSGTSSSDGPRASLNGPTETASTSVTATSRGLFKLSDPPRSQKLTAPPVVKAASAALQKPSVLEPPVSVEKNGSKDWHRGRGETVAENGWNKAWQGGRGEMGAENGWSKSWQGGRGEMVENGLSKGWQGGRDEMVVERGRSSGWQGGRGAAVVEKGGVKVGKPSGTTYPGYDASANNQQHRASSDSADFGFTLTTVNSITPQCGFNPMNASSQITTSNTTQCSVAGSPDASESKITTNSISNSTATKKLSALAPAFVPSFFMAQDNHHDVLQQTSRSVLDTAGGCVDGLADSIAMLDIASTPFGDHLEDSRYTQVTKADIEEFCSSKDSQATEVDDDMESVTSCDSVEILIPHEASCLPFFLSATGGERKGQGARSHSESPAPRPGRADGWGHSSFDDTTLSHSKTARSHCPPRSLSLSGEHSRGRLTSSPDSLPTPQLNTSSLLSFPSLTPATLPILSSSLLRVDLKPRSKKSMHRNITNTKLRISPTRVIGRRSNSHYARPTSRSPRRDYFAGGVLSHNSAIAAALLTDYDLPPNPRMRYPRARSILPRSSLPTMKDSSSYAHHLLKSTGACTSPLAGLLLTTTTASPVSGNGWHVGDRFGLRDPDAEVLDGRAFTRLVISGAPGGYLGWGGNGRREVGVYEGTAMAAERPL